MGKSADEPEAERHAAFALFRLGRAAEALARIERLPAGGEDDPVTLAFRVLCLQELERVGEAQALLGELDGREEAAPVCELEALQSEARSGAGR